MSILKNKKLIKTNKFLIHGMRISYISYHGINIFTGYIIHYFFSSFSYKMGYHIPSLIISHIISDQPNIAWVNLKILFWSKVSFSIYMMKLSHIFFEVLQKNLQETVTPFKSHPHNFFGFFFSIFTIIRSNCSSRKVHSSCHFNTKDNLIFHTFDKLFYYCY